MQFVALFCAVVFYKFRLNFEFSGQPVVLHNCKLLQSHKSLFFAKQKLFRMIRAEGFISQCLRRGMLIKTETQILDV